MEKFMQFLERLVVALERDATAREVNNTLIKAQFDRKNGTASPVVEEAILESKLPPAVAEQQVPGEAGTKTVAKMTEKRKQMVEEYKKRGWVIDPFESTADMEKKVKDSPLPEAQQETVDTTAETVEDEFAIEEPKVDKETLRTALMKLVEVDFEACKAKKLPEAESLVEKNKRAKALIKTVGGADKLSDVKEEAYVALYKAVQTALKG